MKTKDFESRIESGYNNMVLTSDDYMLTISIENKNGRMWAHLIPEKVDELKAAIAEWEELYYNGSDDVIDHSGDRRDV